MKTLARSCQDEAIVVTAAQRNYCMRCVKGRKDRNARERLIFNVLERTRREWQWYLTNSKHRKAAQKENNVRKGKNDPSKLLICFPSSLYIHLLSSCLLINLHISENKVKWRKKNRKTSDHLPISFFYASTCHSSLRKTAFVRQSRIDGKKSKAKHGLRSTTVLLKRIQTRKAKKSGVKGKTISRRGKQRAK